MSFGAVGMGSMIGGALVSAAGELFQGQAQQKMQQYQAGLAIQRSNIADLNAQMATQSGNIQAMETGLRTGQVIGHERVGAGAGNINVDTGSAARVQASQRWAGQTTESIQQTEAARRAFGYQVEQKQDIAQAGVDIAAGETARTASEYAAVATLLGGIGNVASKWGQASQAGLSS